MQYFVDIKSLSDKDQIDIDQLTNLIDTEERVVEVKSGTRTAKKIIGHELNRTHCYWK